MSYRSALETHLSETHDHARRVERRLGELGQGCNPLQAVVGFAESVVGQALALGKTPLDLLRGTGGAEKVLKNAKDAAATEALEIATYTSIERLAKVAGDDKTAQLAASIRADEEKMLARILREIPKLTDAVSTRSLRRRHHRRRRGRQARGQGHQAGGAPGAQGAGRRAGRGRGQGCRRVGGATSRSRATTRSPPTRSSAGWRSSRRSTWPRSTPTSAGTRTARRCSTASPPCAATSRGRAMTSSTCPRSAPRSAEADDERLSAVRAYERAHKDRTSVLDAAERELATA